MHLLLEYFIPLAYYSILIIIVTSINISSIEDYHFRNMFISKNYYRHTNLDNSIGFKMKWIWSVLGEQSFWSHQLTMITYDYSTRAYL